MSEESVFHAADAGTNQSAAAAAAQEDSGARGILRDAIHKVMEEIEHHEREAKHHLEQAAGLRRALRDSVSFLHEQGEKKTPSAILKGSRSEKSAAPPPEEKEKPSAASGKHAKSKKK
jgi:hypothetical protein